MPLPLKKASSAEFVGDFRLREDQPGGVPYVENAANVTPPGPAAGPSNLSAGLAEALFPCRVWEINPPSGWGETVRRGFPQVSTHEFC
jgi:hypothetical protein